MEEFVGEDFKTKGFWSKKELETLQSLAEIRCYAYRGGERWISWKTISHAITDICGTVRSENSCRKMFSKMEECLGSPKITITRSSFRESFQGWGDKLWSIEEEATVTYMYYEYKGITLNTISEALFDIFGTRRSPNACMKKIRNLYALNQHHAGRV